MVFRHYGKCLLRPIKRGIFQGDALSLIAVCNCFLTSNIHTENS